jgi:hypothetical protein
MAALLSPFLKSLQGSCYDYGHPKGALSLGAAAVRFLLCLSDQITNPYAQLHYAFSMYTTGFRVEACHFSRENISETVAVFNTNSQRLTDHRWAQILATYRVGCDGKPKSIVSDSLDEQQFHELYISSSL